MSAPRILVLPGMGDVYWTAVALPALAKREGWTEPPEVHVWDFDGRPRSLDYVKRIPFVTAGGYWTAPQSAVRHFRESYLEDGRSVFRDVAGFDYYLAANGALRHGRTVEQAFGVPCDWRFPMTPSAAEDTAAVFMPKRFGPYAVAYMSDHGMFARWLKAWGVAGCAEMVLRVQQRTGCRVLLTGCAWDRPFAESVRAMAPDAVNLCGETDLDTLFGLMRGSRGVVGWCGGNTILATVLKVPTLIVWSRYFEDARFYRNACPLDAYRRWYEVAVVEDEWPGAVAERFAELVER